MKNYFLDIIDIVNGEIRPGENFTSWFCGEVMDYTRFNQAKIRQAGTVLQHHLELDLIEGRRHASISLGLTADQKTDQNLIAASFKKLREQLKDSQEDPFLMIHEGNTSSSNECESQLQDKGFIIEEVLRTSADLDLVGYYFGGPIYRGFFNSWGQINWFSKTSFVLDTSIYHSRDQAIKQSYADSRFDQSVFAQKVADARLGLELFDKGSRTISPGKYRVYFSPTAVYELLSIINWGGFSRKALEVKTSPLLSLFNKERSLSRKLAIRENISAGMGPDFQSQGFIKKEKIDIIGGGFFKNTLISPKTASEYGLDHNGAEEAEALCSIDMQGGDLIKKDILAALEDGLFINNLWYLNFSDRQNGRLTGMTRFFCYVVKNGKPIAPFSVMRFDDSIYRIFSETNLRHITEERELLIDNSTYDQRSTASAILPGIIVENVRFTL